MHTDVVGRLERIELDEVEIARESLVASISRNRAVEGV